MARNPSLTKNILAAVSGLNIHAPNDTKITEDVYGYLRQIEEMSADIFERANQGLQLPKKDQPRNLPKVRLHAMNLRDLSRRAMKRRNPSESFSQLQDAYDNLGRFLREMAQEESAPLSVLVDVALNLP